MVRQRGRARFSAIRTPRRMAAGRAVHRHAFDVRGRDLGGRQQHRPARRGGTVRLAAGGNHRLLSPLLLASDLPNLARDSVLVRGGGQLIIVTTTRTRTRRMTATPRRSTASGGVTWAGS